VKLLHGLLCPARARYFLTEARVCDRFEPAPRVLERGREALLDRLLLCPGQPRRKIAAVAD
jgi:hypothetical protein